MKTFNRDKGKQEKTMRDIYKVKYIKFMLRWAA